jgi:hypothetical protein
MKLSGIIQNHIIPIMYRQLSILFYALHYSFHILFSSIRTMGMEWCLDENDQTKSGASTLPSPPVDSMLGSLLRSSGGGARTLVLASPTASLRQDPRLIPRDQVQPDAIHLMRVLGVMAEQLEHVLHGEFGRGHLAFDGRVGELSFLLLQVQDPLLDGVLDGHLVDDNILGLVKAVHAVDGLFFDKLFRSVSFFLAGPCSERERERERPR